MTATPLNLLERKSTVKKNDLRAEELEPRVIPSILGSTLSAAVALPRPPEQGIAARERWRARESGTGQEKDRGNLPVLGPEPHNAPPGRSRPRQWRPDGGLRTWQRRSAVVRHPITGQPCWFNQIAFLSEWTIDPELREYLVDEYGEDGLPFNTRFGNGDAIDADVVQRINEVYEANTAREPWQAGDLMLVDNVRTAHGRERFAGPREVLVAMADAVHLADCSPTIEVTPS